MSTRAADDFDAIRARLDEMNRERYPIKTLATPIKVSDSVHPIGPVPVLPECPYCGATSQEERNRMCHGLC